MEKLNMRTFNIRGMNVRGLNGSFGIANGKSVQDYIKEGLVYEWNCLNIAPSIDDGVWTACVGDNTIALTDACSLAEDGGLAVSSTEETILEIANATVIGDDDRDANRVIEFVCKLDTDSSMSVESNRLYTNLVYEDGVWKDLAKFRYGATGVYYYVSTSISESAIWSVGIDVEPEGASVLIDGKATDKINFSYCPESIDNKQVTAIGNVTIYAIRIYDASLIASCSVKEMFVTNNKWNQKNFGKGAVPSNALYDDSGNLLYDDSGNIIGSDN